MFTAIPMGACVPAKRNEKECNGCHKLHPVEKFRRGGPRCRRCEADYAAQYRTKNHAKCKEAHRKWAAINKEKYRLGAKLWQKQNPEKVRAQHAKWIEKNRERYLQKRREWRDSNLELIRAKGRARKVSPKGRLQNINSEARRRQKTARVPCAPTSHQLADLRKEANGVCRYCGKRVKELTFDHVIPLAKGGLHAIHNLVMACRLCNSKKHTKTPEQWAKEIGMLILT